MRPKLLRSHTDILSMAAELFSKKGYRATTMQEIAKKLKVSKPTLYASTVSKEAILGDIIEAWIDHVEGSLQAVVKTPGGPREKLQTLIVSWSRNVVSRRTFHMVFLADERELPPAIVAKYRRWSDSAFHRIRVCVRDGQATGVFRPELDATVVTFSVIAFINSLPQWFNAKGKLTIEQIAERHIDLFEGGALGNAKQLESAAKPRKLAQDVRGAKP